jgi:aspartyl-tRNA(Asn)/glutamyl-tRNA(Gln) amidotransferase subunit A
METTTPESIWAASQALAEGKTTSRALTEACLAVIAHPQGEGGRTFLQVDREGALATADTQDALRRRGVVLSPLAGIPVSVKDLFDVAGQVTAAASRILQGSPAALADAPPIARLRAAGAILIGRTNMTEFAYGGIGMNAHFGTPRSPWQRGANGATDGHVPGGSSSGAAVSVADGMAYGGIGSDTGGSTRIPAAFCGPLSTTLDSVGPLARTVADCHLLDACMAGEAMAPLVSWPLRGLRLAVPVTVMHEHMDMHVATSFAQALNTLAHAGAQVTEMEMPEFAQIKASYEKVTLTGAEAYAWPTTSTYCTFGRK